MEGVGDRSKWQLEQGFLPSAEPHRWALLPAALHPPSMPSSSPGRSLGDSLEKEK